MLTAIDDDAIRARLRAGYLSRLADKVDALMGLWRAAEAGDPAALPEIRSQAHQLAGSGAGFGFPTLTTLARRVERASDTELGDELAGLLRAMTGLQTA